MQTSTALQMISSFIPDVDSLESSGYLHDAVCPSGVSRSYLSSLTPFNNWSTSSSSSCSRATKSSTVMYSSFFDSSSGSGTASVTTRRSHGRTFLSFANDNEDSKEGDADGEHGAEGEGEGGGEEEEEHQIPGNHELDREQVERGSGHAREAGKHATKAANELVLGRATAQVR